ncbi:MAG: ATP-binding cassette domain-containing protein, partial [Eubacteriales bacterium]|nr:ATP-binding cassette domain-containing protein [Eubacteriales bacterium]
MIEIKNLTYTIPEKALYNKIDLKIEEHHHYAFIGTNGTGKSTLVDMILHEVEYLYTGKILYDDSYRNTRPGYVSQFLEEDTDKEQTVFDYISREFVELDQTIEQLCDRMATEEDLDRVFQEYQDALDQKEAIDGDNYVTNIKKQLKIAGIENLEQHSLKELSGGEFKLIQVIKEMMVSPKILFMDEPDVFLDFDHINALVELINSHKGTLLVITHNRYLLNHCFDRIIHLEGCEIQQFEGSYPEYQLELLKTKLENQEIVAKEEEEIDRQQAIVNTMRAQATAMANASLGSRVHARQTIVDRLHARKTKLPFLEIKEPETTFVVEHPLDAEEPALKLSGYEASFEDQLLKDVNLEIKAGEKVAIIGKNGTGKSTILKDIWSKEKTSVQFHEEAEPALFSQMIDDESEEKRTLLEIVEECGFDTPKDAAAYLEKYGFTREEMDKRPGELSGGEKDLFQIARLETKKANFLLLDEPTGHLDLYAQIALEKAIKQYEGGILMVSHDFYLIANCMDYVLLVENQNLRRMSIR